MQGDPGSVTCRRFNRLRFEGLASTDGHSNSSQKCSDLISKSKRLFVNSHYEEADVTPGISLAKLIHTKSWMMISNLRDILGDLAVIYFMVKYIWFLATRFPIQRDELSRTKRQPAFLSRTLTAYHQVALNLFYSKLCSWFKHIFSRSVAPLL